MMKEAFAGIDGLMLRRQLLANRAKKAAEDLGASASQADNLVRVILELNNQARIEAAKQIVQQIEQGDFQGAQVALKLFSSNHGYFSPSEKKQLGELIDSLSPEEGTMEALDGLEVAPSAGDKSSPAEEFSGFSQVQLEDLLPQGDNG